MEREERERERKRKRRGLLLVSASSFKRKRSKRKPFARANRRCFSLEQQQQTSSPLPLSFPLQGPLFHRISARASADPNRASVRTCEEEERTPRETDFAAVRISKLVAMTGTWQSIGNSREKETESNFEPPSQLQERCKVATTEPVREGTHLYAPLRGRRTREAKKGGKSSFRSREQKHSRKQ